MPVSKETTHLLLASKQGDRKATEELLRILYGELRSLAGNLLRHERADHTLQPTALVHEAYLRLVNQREVAWRDRAHFFSAASRVIRQVLVDHARRHAAAKRGGDWGRVTLAVIHQGHDGGVDLLALDEALERLEELSPRQREIVEMRYFGGLTIEETAESLSISPATVKAQWALARAWLRERIAP